MITIDFTSTINFDIKKNNYQCFYNYFYYYFLLSHHFY